MLLILAAIAQAALTLSPLDVRWQMTLDAPPAAPPAYDAATAYVPLRSGGVAAVDLERGLVRWRRDLTTTIAPAAGDALVYVATDGHVEAISAASGETRWRTPLPGALVTVTWDNGWLICSNDAGDFGALRATDGELLWRVSLGTPLAVAPAAGLDKVYVGTGDGRVVSLDLASGQHAWERRLSGRITGLRAVDGQLIVGTTDNAVFSLALDTGRQRWRWRVGGDVSGPAANDDRHVYFAARDNVLRAVDLRTGNMRWIADLPSRPVGGPLVLAGQVLVPLATAVGVFDPATGKPVVNVPVSGEMRTSPHLRAAPRPTGAQLVTVTLDGRMQGFGWRIEEPPARMQELPGARVEP